MFKMKKKVLKKIIVALCAAAMSVPTAASVGAMHNGAPDNANHQQLNPNLNQFRVNRALDETQYFLDNINQQTLDHGYDLDEEFIAASESLQQLKDALNNINNVDFEAMGIGFEDSINFALGKFNTYMRNYGNWGPVNEDKLKKITKLSDGIQGLIHGEDVDLDDYIWA